jgi:hypothetical protein
MSEKAPEYAVGGVAYKGSGFFALLDGNAVGMLRRAAENYDQVRALRRALRAFMDAPNDQAARAGLLQICAELEKLVYNESNDETRGNV